METINFRNLEYNECELIKEIDASQYIGRAWRLIDGKRQLVDINYQDTDWPNGYENHLNHLKKTIEGGGSAIGVFNEDGKLLGLSTVNRSFIGKNYNYVLLDQLFITLEKRNCGIGKHLFLQSAKAAKEWQADKLYICAGSAEETIAFYKRMGCLETMEIQQELYENDPRDLHLEFDLNQLNDL